MARVLLLAAAVLLAPLPLDAQSLAQRIRGAGDATVRLSFAAREGVCGQGHDGVAIGRDDEWEHHCRGEQVHVSLRLLGARVVRANTHIGGRWRAPRGEVTDLGVVPAREAAELLLVLAPGAGDAGGELVMAAALADSVAIWPELLRLARDSRLPVETRRQAVFWLGQAAEDAATRGLDSLATAERDDIEVREHAVFALSQRPAGEGVPALLRIARNNPDPRLRRQALFWLAQADDPRALELFEELLR